MPNMRHGASILAGFCLVGAGAWTAHGDEIDLRIRGIVNFAEGKTTDGEFLTGIQGLSPEDQKELFARSAQGKPHARALILLEFLKIGMAEAGTELDTLLKSGAATGVIKRVGDPIGLREMAWYGREKGIPHMQSASAGILLALEGVKEDSSGLSRAVQILSRRDPKSTHPDPEVNKAAERIGFFHIRGISSGTSQRELELALKANQDPNLQVTAATFLGASGSAKSTNALLDALRDSTITSSTIFKSITRTLIANGNYTDQTRCSLIPDLVKIIEDLDLPEQNRSTARLVASRISGKAKLEDMLAWAAMREKELAGTDASSGGKEPEPGAPDKRPDGPKTPEAGPQEASPPPPPPRTPDPQDECARWLLLAKNFMNMKNWEKAEENLNRVLQKSPEGKLAEEARILLRRIEAVKGL